MNFKNFSEGGGGGEPSPREFDEERSATVRFLAGSAPDIFRRNSAEVIQIVLKTSAIISSFQKMLIQSDSKQ